jgi:hypothetical protein
MAHGARNAIDFDDEGSVSPMLVRFLVWGGLAAIAMGAATLAAQTQTGAQRFAEIFGQRSPASGTARSTAALAAPVVKPQVADAELESRRLAESIRLLAADRDRLLARIDALERNLDVTASASPENTPQPSSNVPTAPALPPGWSLVPSNLPPAAGVPASTVPPPASTAPQEGKGALVANQQAAESVATRTEFAVDIGGHPTFEGLRSLWAGLKANHATLFEGLKPVVAVREGAKPGALELRLVVGPLNNANAAARLCASLGAAGLPCQPTIFDGQRFALR